MVNWWWIPPAIVGVLGFLLALNGLASFFAGRWVTGPLRLVGGVAAAWAATAAALLGLNAQTYARLTYERPVAEIALKQLGPQYYEATVTKFDSAGKPADTRLYPVNGDDWRVEARVLKWKPWANVLGLDSQYRLERLAGRYENIEQERHGARSVHDISGDDQPPEVLGQEIPWKPSVWETGRRLRPHWDAVDTLYGGATYMPMTDGAKYEVWITQSGLIARPANPAAQAASQGGWALR
jgi:hypothetical protein